MSVSTISNRFIPGGARNPNSHRPWCTQCHTDRFLTIETIEAIDGRERDVVSVSYNCGECEYFYRHAAKVPQVAAILNRPGPPKSLGVLQFGGEYIHCGEPMHVAGSELRNAYAVMKTDREPDSILDVYLTTRVLRCSCGFQMEIPD
jgi:hypothetical protein